MWYPLTVLHPKIGKIEVIKKVPEPQTVKEIRSFLGMTGSSAVYSKLC